MNLRPPWSSDQETELHGLLTALLDERLSAEDEARLAELLSNHAEARRLYLDYFELHNALWWRSGGAPSGLAVPALEPEDAQQQAALFTDRAAPMRARTTARLRNLGPWIVAAASLFLAVGVIWRISPDLTNRTAAPQATVLHSSDAIWSLKQPTVAEDEFPLGPFRLETGQVTVRVANGTEIVFQAPVSGRLVSTDLLQIELGRITVRCETESAFGFRVVTPAAELIDLGTEFGVLVEPGGTSEVHVFDGVVVARLGDQKLVPVYRDEAGRVQVAGDATGVGLQPSASERAGDFSNLAVGELVAIAVDRAKFLGRAASPRERVPPASTRPAVTFPRPPGKRPRIVFLGDEDGTREVHLLLINQTLRDLPEDIAPQMFNSSVTYHLLAKDPSMFETLIGSFRPTHAVINFQLRVHDSIAQESMDQVGSALEWLVNRLEEAQIEPIFVTARPYAASQGDILLGVRLYNEMIRDLANRRGYRIADIAARFATDQFSSSLVNSYDRLTFEGARVTAAEMLSALGYAGFEVPTALDLTPMPGAVTSWKYRIRSVNGVPTAESVAAVEPDDTWSTLQLPQQDRFGERLPDPSHSFPHLLYARGFACADSARPTLRIEAVADIDSPVARDVWLNPGGAVQSVWLNGELLFDGGDEWNGWHPGKVRLPARLRAGRNRVFIESLAWFFLSVTEQRDWALPRPGPSTN